MFWVSGFPSLFFKSCLAAENPRSDIKRPKDGLKPQAALLGLAKRCCPTAGTGRVTPGWCWVLGQPRTAGAWSGGYGGPRRLPSPPRAAPRHGVFLKILLGLRRGEGSGLPHTPRPHGSIPGHQQDAGLALDLSADEDKETNSCPWTRETLPGEVQLLPGKKKKQGKQSLGTAQRWF